MSLHADVPTPLESRIAAAAAFAGWWCYKAVYAAGFGGWALSTTAAGRSALTLHGAGLESSASTPADSGAHCGWGGCPGLKKGRLEMSRAVVFEHLLCLDPPPPTSLPATYEYSRPCDESWLQKLFDIQTLHDLPGLKS